MKEFDLRLSLILVFVLNQGFIDAHTSAFNKSIFLEVGNYCDLMCAPNNTHTLCNASDTAISSTCDDNFYEYDLNQNSLKRDLMDGHNGLRNRIAGKMNVSDMRKLSWDPELSRMASVWIRGCYGSNYDHCTSQPVLQIKDGKRSKFINDGEIVHQLLSIRRSKFFPPEFIANILQGWYLEKNLMQPPRVSKNRGSFRVNNNFTQLAWATTFRIGCAVARNGELYILICNYFPYNHPFRREPAFSFGKPVSLCPNLAPLQDVKFANLCTGDDRGHRIEANFTAILIVVLISILNK